MSDNLLKTFLKNNYLATSFDIITRNMIQNRVLHLLALLATSFLLLTGCSKTSSTDNPLPISYSPSIIIGSDNYAVVSVDPTTGKKNWSYGLPGQVLASPIVYFERVYVIAANSDTVYKLDSRTGKLINKFPIRPNIFIPLSNGANSYPIATPIASNNLLYISSTIDTIYAIDTGTGAIKWSFGADAPVVSSPSMYSGNLYFGSMNNTMYSVNASNGTLNWNLNMPYTGIHGFVSSSAVSYPYVYIGSLDSNVYSFYLSPSAGTTTGIKRYNYKTGGQVYSSPCMAGGSFLIGSEDQKLYCIDTQTFGIVWTHPTGGYVNSSPFYCASQQVVYVGCYDNNIYALNIKDGSNRWTPQNTTHLISSSPVVYGSNVYIGSYDKNLYAFDTATGTLKWTYALNGVVEWCSPAVDNLTTTEINSAISGFTN